METDFEKHLFTHIIEKYLSTGPTPQLINYTTNADIPKEFLESYSGGITEQLEKELEIDITTGNYFMFLGKIIKIN